jgi:hypothetical protein
VSLSWSALSFVLGNPLTDLSVAMVPLKTSGTTTCLILPVAA